MESMPLITLIKRGSMATVAVKNEQGAVVGEITLDPSVFGVAVKPTVLHEAVVAQQANARRVIAHTKTRSEVRGGGKKPWRQKGTGRARHGSIRSPIWIGGGVTHGPRSSRTFGQRFNRKKRALAIRMALSDKATADAIQVMDSFALPEYKTKRVVAVMQAFKAGNQTLLLILPEGTKKTAASARNIPTVTVRNVSNLNVVDLLRARMLLTTREGVERITALFKPRR